MTCLGWKTKKGCQTRGEVTLGQPATPASGTCPDITWFYLTAGVIGILAMMGHPSGNKGVVESTL